MIETYSIQSPTGEPIEIETCVDTARDIYSSLGSPAKQKAYYLDKGYVICRSLIPDALCDAALKAFRSSVKPYRGFIYRQASANPEKHKLTEHGFMLNSILNIQDLENKKFADFRACGLEIFTHKNLQKTVSNLLGEQGKIVQTMFFEGNPSTWPHQDTYYLDSEKIGEMVGAWIALEDIHPGAGRFYVYPESHKIDLEKNGGNFDIAFNHDRYKKLVIDVIKNFNLECRAPALKKGDVFFWSSKTMHGSLMTGEPQYSRSSFTAHFIPESHRFLQLQSRIKPLKLKTVSGISIHHPKDQNVLSNRIIFFIETRFPKLFQALKKMAVKKLTS